ncbi:MAG: hypothetical protein IJS50_00520, partial [Desulfovibrio sp.]|nr:hypothetical protein [Desulfovibrio sp.]
MLSRLDQTWAWPKKVKVEPQLWYVRLEDLLKHEAWIKSRLNQAELAKAHKALQTSEGRRFAARRAFLKEILARVLHRPALDLNLSF